MYVLIACTCVHACVHSCVCVCILKCMCALCIYHSCFYASMLPHSCIVNRGSLPRIGASIVAVSTDLSGIRYLLRPTR